MHYQPASEQVIGKILDDEAVIINLDTGMYFGLDGIAAKIWELLVAGTAHEAVSDALKRAFPAEAGIDSDLAHFLADLCGRGLIVAADGDAQATLPDAIDWPAVYQAPVMASYDDVAEMVALDPPLPELSHHMIDQPGQARANAAT